MFRIDVKFLDKCLIEYPSLAAVQLYWDTYRFKKQKIKLSLTFGDFKIELGNQLTG